MIISAGRFDAIIDELNAAGDDWPRVARRLPEYLRLSQGVPSGPGLVRPWVLLHGEHEYLEMPPRVIRYENGCWFHKGQYKADVERRTNDA